MIDIDHEDTILRTFILFVQTARAVLKYTDTHLYRKARLSTIKLIALQGLANNSGVMTPSEIAEWTHTERHNVTTLVDRLKQGGLITTERNSSDRRLINVTLTDKGRKILGQAMPVAWDVVNQVMSSMSEGDAILLEKRLRNLRQNAHDGLDGFAKRP